MHNEVTKLKEAIFIANQNTSKIAYHQVEGYLIPNLTLPAEEKQPIGIWGQLHLQYIRQQKQVLFTELLMSGKLNSYLADINIQAEEMFSWLIDQMAEREGITDQLKEENRMLWMGKMNSIQETERKLVNSDLIYI